MANPIAYDKPKRRQMGARGLSNLSAAVSYLIPFVLSITGDTWQIETGKAFIMG